MVVQARMRPRACIESGEFGGGLYTQGQGIGVVASQEQAILRPPSSGGVRRTVQRARAELHVHVQRGHHLLTAVLRPRAWLH